MRRREFMTLLGGAVVANPLGRRAQQAGQVPTVGYWAQTRRSLLLDSPRSWIDCVNWAGSRVAPSRSSIGSRKAVPSASPRSWASCEQKVDVIVTSGGAVVVFKQATATIPIVFSVASDPVRVGLVASLVAAGRQRHRIVGPVGR